MLLEYRAERVVESRPAFVGRTGCIDLPLVQCDEIVPSRRPCIQTFERIDGLLVKPHIEDLFVDRDGRTRVPDLLVAKACLLEEELLAFSLAFRGIGASPDDVEKSGVVLRLLVEGIERQQRPRVITAQIESACVILLRKRRILQTRPRNVCNP